MFVPAITDTPEPGSLLVIVATPVGVFTEIPVPATSDVTPVLVQLTAPVVGEQDTPDTPVTDVGPVLLTTYDGPPVTRMPVPEGTDTDAGAGPV